MNLGRFHGAIWSLKQEFTEYDVLKNLQQVVSVLSQSVSQPNTQTAANFKTQLSSLSEVLSQCPSNQAPPSRRRLFKELGAEDKIGIGLLEKINTILAENTITPADALQSLQKLAKEVEVFYGTITTLTVELDKLDAEYDELDKEEFEIGICIPESVLKASLSNVEKELKCINQLFTLVSEIATGEVGHFTLRTIGSTDLGVYLDTIALVGACTATAIERIVELYKKQLEIKKIKQELKQMQMPSKVTTPFDDYLKELVQKELNDIAKDIVKEFYHKKDSGRKNELITHLSKTLGYMAERIDKGATFEVRAGLPKEPEKPAAENEEAYVEYQKNLTDYEEMKEKALGINQAGRKVGELTSRDIPILMLPEPYDPEDNPQNEE